MDNSVFLVVGGAGYIGSHMALMLQENGHQVIVVDDLSTGFRDAVTGAEFIQANVHDFYDLDRIFKRRNIDVVMHFAAHIDVGESMRDPFKYYRNNVAATQTLLECMAANGVNNFIFSSSAAIFGAPEYTPIDEAHVKHPINPYGHSKLMVEKMLESYTRVHGFKAVCLRYFNAAGADPQTRLGERHDPETHLIPLVLQAASGRRPCIRIFGDDYATADGTCIRDYVHVTDLCRAHLLAVRYMLQRQTGGQFNLGNGSGYSVRQVIDAARRVTNRHIKVERAHRREGDPATLVADARLAGRVLHWTPEYPDLEEIVEHAWKWEIMQQRCTD